MFIFTRRAKDRRKATMLHGGSQIKVSIHSDAEWQLLRDRLDDTVADLLSDLDEGDRPFLNEFPTVQLSLTCDLSTVTNEREFEEYTATIYRLMSRQHPSDARLTVIISPELRSRFDSIEWAHREACAAQHRTTFAHTGQIPKPSTAKDAT